MSSLFGALTIAVRSLRARGNASASGRRAGSSADSRRFARHGGQLSSDAKLSLGDGIVVPAGAEGEAAGNVRKELLELRLYQEAGQQAALRVFLDVARQVKTLLRESEGAGLEDALTDFFTSLLELQENPSSLPVRKSVLEGGWSLAEEFRRTLRTLFSLRENLGDSIRRTVGEINRLTAEVAALNGKVRASAAGGQTPADLFEERARRIRELAELAEVSVLYSQDGTASLSLCSGVDLLAGRSSFVLETSPDTITQSERVFAQGKDITARISSGRLGGEIQAREETVSMLVADLETLASCFVSEFNGLHCKGYDLSGSPGADFYTPPGASREAATTISVALASPEQIAASRTGTPGDNGNALELAALWEKAVVNGKTPLDFYFGLAARIHNEVATASAELEAESLVLQQLENQRAAVSDLQLGEEAVNLVRFQRAFEASARIAGVVEELTSTVLGAGEPAPSN